MSVEVALLGFAVGMLVGLSGVGAGVLMAPALILMGVHPGVAIGTDLAYSALTKAAGAARYAAQGLVDGRWLFWSSVGGLPGTLAGAGVARWLPNGAGAEHLLRLAVAGALVIASAAIVVKDLAGRRGPPGDDLARTRPWRVSAAGALTGVLVGLTSIGGGALFMLLLLACSRLPPRQAVATDIANAALLTAPAALVHLWSGSVDLSLTANLLLGSIPGVMLATRLVRLVPVRPLRYGMVLLVMVGGVRMMLP